MRIAALLSAAVLALVATAPAAEAQSRRGQPMTIKVQPRSYLDAGKIPLPGSGYHRQIELVTFMSSPVYTNSDRFGDSVLPSRIGGGANPFGRF